jgi:hypothetical protein
MRPSSRSVREMRAKNGRRKDGRGRRPQRPACAECEHESTWSVGCEGRNGSFEIPSSPSTARWMRRRRMTTTMTTGQMGLGGCCGAAGSAGCRGARPGSGAGDCHAPRTQHCTRCRHVHAHPRAPRDGDSPFCPSRQRPWSSRSTRRAWSPRAQCARACADAGSPQTASRNRCTRSGARHRAP